VGMIAEKEGFKSGMKERVRDEKLIIISVAVRGINDHIRFYSQMLCTAAINTSNTTMLNMMLNILGCFKCLCSCFLTKF